MSTNKEGLAFSFIMLAYRDYIAARFLINNNYILQGLTLASTAIEKYIKVLLIINGKTKKDMRVHLDKVPQLKQQLSSCYYDVTQKMDERFLAILGKMYSIRYYDDIQSPVTIGFFINQFLGELDTVVHFFETKVIISIKDEKGNAMITPYHRGINEQDKDLLENNYIFKGITKKEHMEQPDTGFAIYIHPNTLAIKELEVNGSNIINSYDGLMSEINVNFV